MSFFYVVPRVILKEAFRCSSWFHVECSGLKKDDPCLTNENIDFVCMSCVRR